MSSQKPYVRENLRRQSFNTDLFSFSFLMSSVGYQMNAARTKDVFDERAMTKVFQEYGIFLAAYIEAHD